MIYPRIHYRLGLLGQLFRGIGWDFGNNVKPETLSGILMHKYWNRKHCIEMPHCHIFAVNIIHWSFEGGANKYLPTRNSIIEQSPSMVVCTFSY